MSEHETKTIPTTALARPDAALKGLLASPERMAELGRALPKHLTPDRLLHVALTAVIKSPELLACTPASVLNSIKEAGQLGLVTDGVLGHAYLIAYGNTATLQIGYRGFEELITRTGLVSKINKRLVFKGEKFIWTEGLTPNLVHEPDLNVARDWDHLLAAYCVIFLKDGTAKFRVVPKSEIEKRRNCSKARSGGSPWQQWPLEMAEKTAVRAIAKEAQLSTEVTRAAVLDEYNEAGVHIDTEAVVPLKDGHNAFGFKRTKALPEVGAEPQGVETPAAGATSLPQSKQSPTAAPLPSREAPRDPAKEPISTPDELPPDEEIGGVF